MLGFPALFEQCAAPSTRLRAPFVSTLSWVALIQIRIDIEVVLHYSDTNREII
jgi:hypothetical protein